MIDERVVNFRLACVVQVAELLRDAINRNGGMYSGSLVPNIQSISDVCAVPYPMLVDQVKQWPPLVAALTTAGMWPPPEGN